MLIERILDNSQVFWSLVGENGNCTIDVLCLLMNIVPCKEIKIIGMVPQHLLLKAKPFHVLMFNVNNREHDWRYRSKIVERGIEIKHNTN